MGKTDGFERIVNTFRHHLKNILTVPSDDGWVILCAMYLLVLKIKSMKEFLEINNLQDYNSISMIT